MTTPPATGRRPNHSASVPRLALHEDVSLTVSSVTELVKDLQKEHAAQLSKERELVVHQVLQSLESKGLLKKARRRRESKPSKLDAHLHSLHKHSLQDNGLQYPHVLQDAPPLVQIPSDAIRPLVLERQELTDVPLQSRQVPQQKHRQKQDASYLEESLRVAKEGEEMEIIEPLLMRSKRTSKMDNKTWLILEQSKKLLKENKTRGYKPGKIAAKPTLIEQEALSNDLVADTTPLETTSVQGSPSDVLSSEKEIVKDFVETSLKNPTQNQVDSYQLSLLDPFPTSYATENSDKAWENELARQILSLYATSMSTKKEPETNPSIKAETTPRRSKSQKLPAIERKKRIQNVQDSWQPSHLENGKVVLCLPKIPKPIWFAGTGVVLATWCALALPDTEVKLYQSNGNMNEGVLCRHKLCQELRNLEQQIQFEQYIAVVETLLMSRTRSKQNSGADEFDLKLWKQLVITANAFASRAIDYKKFPLALTLVKKTEDILDNSSLLVGAVRIELLAYISDTYAYYYYSRGKATAGVHYLTKAHAVHSKHSEWSHLAKCKLHMATLLSKLQQHDEAIRELELILGLVEDAKLEEDGGGASAQKLCLVAVCYNNLALEQLHLKDVDGAATSCQNARRLARLCLSYSNRWLKQFEGTNKAVIRAMATIMGEQGEIDVELVMKYDIEA